MLSISFHHCACSHKFLEIVSLINLPFIKLLLSGIFSQLWDHLANESEVPKVLEKICFFLLYCVEESHTLGSCPLMPLISLSLHHPSILQLRHWFKSSDDIIFLKILKLSLGPPTYDIIFIIRKVILFVVSWLARLILSLISIHLGWFFLNKPIHFKFWGLRVQYL